MTDPDALGYINQHGLSRKVNYFVMSRVLAQRLAAYI